MHARSAVPWLSLLKRQRLLHVVSSYYFIQAIIVSTTRIFFVLPASLCPFIAVVLPPDFTPDLFPPLFTATMPSSTRSPRPRSLRPTGRPLRIIDTDPHLGRLQDIIIPDTVKRRLGGLQPQYLLLAAGAIAAVRQGRAGKGAARFCVAALDYGGAFVGA